MFVTYREVFLTNLHFDKDIEITDGNNLKMAWESVEAATGGAL